MDIESTLTSWSDNTWPDYSPDQILPGLFQGGTQDEEVLGFAAPTGHYARLDHRGGVTYPGFPFGLVVTLDANAQPVWFREAVLRPYYYAVRCRFGE